MTKFLFIRHGESDGNRYRLFTGQGDLPLTELGHRQAEAAADYIVKTYGNTIDAAYASDLSRAWDTGKTAADRLGLTMIPDRGLREINSGAWEGVSFADLPVRFKEDFALWMQDIGRSRCTGGESVAELSERVYAAVVRIAEENPGKTVLIATHATPIRTLQCRFAGVGLEEMQQIPWVPNASLTEAVYEDGRWSDVKIGETCYLTGITTNLPKDV